MDKEEEVTLTFKHVRHDKTERSFTGKVVKPATDYNIVLPDRALFLQHIKFAPGKGPKDYIEFHKHLDEELKKKYGKTRCEMDVHEIATFLTLGSSDMTVLWDAKNSETFNRVMAAGLNPDGSGKGETQTVMGTLTHGPI